MDAVAKRKILAPAGNPGRSAVTILTELPRLTCIGSKKGDRHQKHQVVSQAKKGKDVPVLN
jgi:hypothetical protein